MYHPRLRSIHSPLTPIPPMSQSSFDFSPAAISRCLEASKSTTPSVLKSRRSYTPSNFLNFSPPDISPIEFLSNSVNRNLVSPNTTAGSNSSMNKGDESISYDLDGSQQNLFNGSNINNRHLNISTVLDDLGLKQYKTKFEIEEIDLMAFLLLTDSDLQEIGVKDEHHREVFTGMIEKLNSLVN